MKIYPVKTEKISVKQISLLKLTDKYIKSLKEGSIVAFTSKVVSLCEGSAVKIGTVDKN